MTVIAWDGKILAADKRAVFGTVVYPVRKVSMVDNDRMAGISGHIGFGMQIVHWLRQGGIPADFPTPTDGKGEAGEGDAYVMVIHRSGLIHLHEASAYPIVIESEQFAIGCGKPFALAAMRCGKSAGEAVEIASEFDVWCGNGIDTLSFEPPVGPNECFFTTENMGTIEETYGIGEDGEHLPMDKDERDKLEAEMAALGLSFLATFDPVEGVIYKPESRDCPPQATD